MHQVFLACIVCGGYEVPVIDIFVPEHASRTVSGVLEHHVELRGYVLGGEDLDVGLLLLRVGEQGAPVAELCVRGLGVILRQGGRSV